MNFKKWSLLFLSLASFSFIHAATFTSNATGNWNAGATWVGGVAPSAATDDVIIRNGHTVTVNVTTTIRNVTIGTTANNTTLQITTAGITLNITGALLFNQNNNGSTYLLRSGPGTINIGGSIAWSAASGTHEIRVNNAAGTINISNNLTISDDRMTIYNSNSGGNLNFLSNLTERNTRINAATGSNVRIYGDYTVSSTATDWTAGNNSARRCNLYLSGANNTITANVNVTFPFLYINTGASYTLANTGTTVLVMRFMYLLAGSTFTMNMDFEVRRGWFNNGGTLVGNGNDFFFTCSSTRIREIGGTTPTDFPHLHIGRSAQANATNINITQSISCDALTFEPTSNASNSTITQTTSGSVTVDGDISMNQRTANNSVIWNVNTATVNAGGDLLFLGTNNTVTRIARINVTSGQLNVAGTLAWMNQPATAAVVTEVITLTTGQISFGESISMARGTGTINVNGAGSVYFNGTTAPSFSLNATGAVGTTNASFTTTSGCNLYFENGFTNANVALTLANGSTSTFTGTGTITPSFLITFGNVVIDNGSAVTLAGNISVTNNWTDNGSFTPGTNTVTFNGTAGGTQTVGRPGGTESFYVMTASTATSTIQMTSDIMVSNTLNMSGHDFNANGFIISLGNSAIATLTRTGGIVYGGTFRRWIPSGTAISSSGAPLYGLFPVGVSGGYRPVTINSTANATTAGFVSVQHVTSNNIVNVTYNDNEASSIQRISVQKAAVSSASLVGGTYTVGVTFGGFAAPGTAVLSHYKQITYTSSVFGSAGTTVATTGTIASPTVTKSGLSVANLNNDFVCGTTNSTNTPIRLFYYSRKASGNWTDNNATTGTWSFIPGGAGAACGCVPVASGYAVVSDNQSVTVDAGSTIDFIDISTGGNLVIANPLAVSSDLTTYGSGVISGNSTLSVTNSVYLNGTGASTRGGTTNITNSLFVNAGASLSMIGGAALNITGSIEVDGTLDVGSGTTTLNGTNRNIDGTGTISGAGVFTTTSGNKTVLSTANLTVSAPWTIASAITVTNLGIVTMTANLIGSAASSTWINSNGSTLNTSAAILATGTLTANASGNMVEYNAAGAQTIKVPSAGYFNLRVSNSGTKTPAASFVVSNELHIANSAILNSGTFVISGTGNLRMDGTVTSEYILQRGSAGSYPELSGSYILTAGTVTINQTSGTCDVNSAVYFNLNFTGSQSYDMADVSTITNNFTIQGSSVWINGEDNPLTVGGTTTYSSSAATNMPGDLSTGSFLQSSGTFNDVTRVMNITGSGWTRNGGTNTMTGTTSFTGSAAQSIAGSVATVFSDLVINNTGSGVTLNQDADVSSSLTLTDGLLHTSSSNILTVRNGAATSLGNSGSYVDGPMNIILASASSENLQFPLGKASDWRPMELNVTHSAATSYTYTAELFNASAAALSYTLPGGVNGVSAVHYYQVDRSNASTDLTAANIIMYYSNSNGSGDGVSDFANLTVLKAPNGGPTWTNIGGTATGNGDGSITSGNFVTFSIIALGNLNGGGNPLPIELLTFDANKKGETVEIGWSTASEINSDYFVIERSTDGFNFEQIGTQKAAGYSSELLNYFTIDEAPKAGFNYYRLNMVDRDGTYEFSSIEEVYFGKALNQVSTIFPNPAQKGELIHVDFNTSIMDRVEEISIHDAAGKMIYNASANHEYGSVITLSELPNLTVGLYFVTVRSSQSTDVHKLLIR